MKKGIILNGTNSIAVAKENDLVHRLSPVPEFTVIRVGSLPNDVPTPFVLSEFLDCSYRVVSCITDEESDDRISPEDNPENASFWGNVLDIRLIEQDRYVGHISIGKTNYNRSSSPLYLHPHQILQIIPRNDVQALRFTARKLFAVKRLT